MNTTKKVFCFGYGYACDYLGHELLNQGGWNVAGTTRDREKQAALKARGVDVVDCSAGGIAGPPSFRADGLE